VKVSASVAGGAAAALLLLTACRGGDEGTAIDPAKAERELAEAYESQVEGARVASVDCPAAIDDTIGTRAACTMRLEDGTVGTIDLRVLDDEGHLRWDVNRASPR